MAFNLVMFSSPHLQITQILLIILCNLCNLWIIARVMKKFGKSLLITLSILMLVVAILAARIYSFSSTRSNQPADAAIVLGAAVWSAVSLPVFRERINHGIDLYRKGKVRKLIFTGGQGNPGEPTESSRRARLRSTERSSSTGHSDRREVSYHRTRTSCTQKKSQTHTQ